MLRLASIDKVHTSMYNVRMKEIETVGIKAFSQAVSAYVRKAKLGVQVLLSDRGKIVAVLKEPGEDDEDTIDIHPALRDLVQDGKLHLGSQKSVSFPRGKPVCSEVDSFDLLDELRGE